MASKEEVLREEMSKWIGDDRKDDDETQFRFAMFVSEPSPFRRMILDAMEKYTVNSIMELYEEIKHGDADHQKWLKDKIESFINRKNQKS